MDKSFQYFSVFEYQDQLSVENIGNCCIHCGNDLGMEYILIVRTIDIGITYILRFGPIFTLNEKFGDWGGCNCSYQRFNYDDRKIAKAIKEFINMKGASITWAMQVDLEEIKDKIFDISKEFFNLIGVQDD